MGHVPEFNVFGTRDSENATEIGERRSDHSVVSRTAAHMPNPFDDRELIIRSMWKKLDESTYFYLNSTCEHNEFPVRPGVVRVNFRRSIKLTKINAKLTRVEMSGSADLGGRIPRSINNTVTIPFIAASTVGLHQYESASARDASANNNPSMGVVRALIFFRACTDMHAITPPPPLSHPSSALAPLTSGTSRASDPPTPSTRATEPRSASSCSSCCTRTGRTKMS
jgi:hypothetical protein